MRSLLIYFATGDTMKAAANSVALNRERLSCYDQFNKVIITDEETPCSIPFPVIRIPNLYNNERFSAARAQNAGMDYAAQAGMDQIVILGADNMLMEDSRDFHESAYTLWHYFGVDGEMDIMDLNKCQQCAGCFVLSSEIFKRYRMCESFSGHGFEDVDFANNVLWAAGYRLGSRGPLGMHIWHPRRSWFTEDREDANRFEYIKRVATYMRTRGMSMPESINIESYWKSWIHEEIRKNAEGSGF